MNVSTPHSYLRQVFLYPLACQRTYMEHAPRTLFDCAYAKYRSVGRMNASNLISSNLAPRIKRAYQITIKLKALYSSVRALNSARLIG